MINPIDIQDGFVAKLRDIPGLVAEMGGNANNIMSFKRQFPDYTNFRRFVGDQVGPAIIISWHGQYGGSTSSMEVWKHTFLAVFISPIETGSSNPTPWLYRVWRQFVKGVPASGGGLKMDQIDPHPLVLPMDVPSIEWTFGDEVGIDLPQATIVFTEKGDD